MLEVIDDTRHGLAGADFQLRPRGRRRGRLAGPRTCPGYPDDDTALSYSRLRDGTGRCRHGSCFVARWWAPESVAYRRQPSARSLRTDVVTELKTHRCPDLVYTVNDHGAESLAEHLAEIGVDGLFTDDPGGLRQYFDQTRSEAQGGPR